MIKPRGFEATPGLCLKTAFHIGDLTLEVYPVSPFFSLS